jgi:chromosome segregation ATPase
LLVSSTSLNPQILCIVWLDCHRQLARLLSPTLRYGALRLLYGKIRTHFTILAVMPPTTETDLKELRDLLTANHAVITQQIAVTNQQIAATNQQIAALSQRVEVGFAQVDTKFAQVDTKLAQVDTKLAQVDTKLAEMNGTIQSLDQKLSSEIKSLDQKLSGEIKSLDQKLSGEINAFDQKLSGEIKALDQKLSGEIQTLDQKLSGEIQTLDQKLSGEIKTLDQKATGIDDRLKSQDTKLIQIDANQRELTIEFIEMKGELKIVRQPIASLAPMAIEFWEFVKRAVVSGLTVTVVGGLLLAAWKLVIFGTLKI